DHGDVPTYLEPSELEWLADKLNRAEGRKSVLLSHHQLFSAFEPIGGNAINGPLYEQMAPLLPKVTRWFLGHEHSLLIYQYQPHLGVHARCIGHGAIPVDYPGQGPRFEDIKYDAPVLGYTGKFYNHGHVLIELDGASAQARYYQDAQPGVV